MKKIIFILTLILFLTGCKTEQVQKEYTVTFYCDGKILEERTLNYGELVKMPENPTKEGYTFSHWATHEHTTDGSEVFDFDKAPNESIGLFAHFTKNVENNSTNSEENKAYGYERIYNEYTQRLKNECPNLSMKECAEISNEGITKMAEYMYDASGKDGQYATYQVWAQKLMDVYLQEVR